MTAGRAPFAWERAYPAGVRWDAPIERTTVPALLDRAAAQHGERIAIEYRGRRIGFAELARLASEAAAGLIAEGIRPGDRVALYLPNSAFHPVSFFAVLRAGARVVHLSPLDAERELAHKLRDSGARTLVTTNLGSMPATALKLAEAGLVDRLICGDEADWGPTGPLPVVPLPAAAIPFARLLEAGGRAPPAAWPRVAVDDLALLQYTGGTTGIPKGAMLTHGNLTAAVSSYRVWSEGQGLSRPGEEKVICVLPLFHIYALTAVFLRQIAAGNELLLRLRFDVETTLRDIEEGRATAFPGVPTMWIALAAHPGIETCDLSSLRHCSSGGAPLPVEVAQRFERLAGRRIGGGWGMTETSPAGTNIPDGTPMTPGLIGVPLPGVELAVVALDDPRRVLPPGEVGEIRVRGANVTSGYWNRPEESAACFVDGFFLTGDIVSMDEAGLFTLVDRKKDMIISGGFNVYPRAVEEAIYEHPDVEEVIVIGVPDDYRGEAAKAFVKLREGRARFTLEELRAFLADKLGRHELPSALEFRDALPRTSVGKLAKKALLDEERAKARAAAPAA
jgi:long-chain acyl-CoA synthetase